MCATPLLDSSGYVISFGKQTYSRLGRKEAKDIDVPLGPGRMDERGDIDVTGLVAGELRPHISAVEVICFKACIAWEGVGI